MAFTKIKDPLYSICDSGFVVQWISARKSTCILSDFAPNRGDTMRSNWDIVIVGSQIVLAPYRRQFVQKYHSWMQDETLLESTCSEKLTLEEEYSMQESWRDDEKKCTFIILDGERYRESMGKGLDMEQWNVALEESMVGDVNVFFNDPDDDPTAVEIEVMVAEMSYRKRGIGKEAVVLMMRYCINQLSTKRFRAQILEDNLASIALFRNLKYRETKRIPVFHEVVYELSCEIDDEAWLNVQNGELNIQPYPCQA